jgi:hypothetical protein
LTVWPLFFSILVCGWKLKLSTILYHYWAFCNSKIERKQPIFLFFSTVSLILHMNLISLQRTC